MNREDFKQGLLDIAPMAFAYAPISALWGAIAAQHGLTVFEATFMSFWVYSGAAQFVSMDIWNSGTPLVLVVFTNSYCQRSSCFDVCFCSAAHRQF